jgi:hypothetical protein
MSELMRHVAWQDYAPGIKYRVLAALKRAERSMPYCLLCRKPKQSAHAYVPDSAKRVGGEDAPIRTYGLCRHHADAPLSRIELALGLHPPEEVSSATD